MWATASARERWLIPVWVAFASVNTAAVRLVDIGILRIAKGARRERLFQATQVLDLFDRFRHAPRRPP